VARLLIGYDVEPDSYYRFFDDSVAMVAHFCQVAGQLHRELEAPCTMFLVGRFVEEAPEAFAPLRGHPFVDIQSHTYTHLSLKTVVQENAEGTTFIPAATVEQIRAELRLAGDAIERHLGVRPTGLGATYGYYRGLKDRPDLLALVWETGHQWVRSYGRNQDDWQPVPFTVQPFWYGPQGFPHLLEIPFQGYQDLFQRMIAGWENIDGFVDLVRADLEMVAAGDLTWSWCLHPWSALHHDPELRAVREVIGHARRLGVELLSHQAYFERAYRARHGGSPIPTWQPRFGRGSQVYPPAGEWLA